MLSEIEIMQPLELVKFGSITLHKNSVAAETAAEITQNYISLLSLIISTVGTNTAVTFSA